MNEDVVQARAALLEPAKRKATLGADEYDNALENLLVELAMKSKEIRAMEGRS